MTEENRNREDEETSSPESGQQSAAGKQLPDEQLGPAKPKTNSDSQPLDTEEIPAHMRRLAAYQKALRIRTFGSIASAGYLMATGIVALAIGFVANLAETRQWEFLASIQPYLNFFTGLGYVVGILSLAGGLINLMFALITKSKKVVCPKCRTHDNVVATAKKLACTRCWSVLLLGGDSNHQPGESSCPYCDSISFVADDFGEFRCPDCGVSRHSGTGAVDARQQNCPSCGAVIPQSALFCKKCHTVTIERVPILDADDETMRGDKSTEEMWDIQNLKIAKEATDELADPYWIDGKSSKGRLLYAMAVLDTMRRDASFVVTDHKKMGFMYAKFADLIQSLKKPLEDGNVASDQQLKDLMSKAITMVDVTYADLIQVQLREAEKLFMSGRKVYDTDTKAIQYSSHISARQDIVFTAKNTSIPLDKAEKWKTKLIECKKDVDVLGGAMNSNKEWYVKEADLSRLREEARRLREWAASRRN